MTIHETPLYGDIGLYRGENIANNPRHEATAGTTEIYRNRIDTPLISAAPTAFGGAAGTGTAVAGGREFDMVNASVGNGPLLWKAAGDAAPATPGSVWSAATRVKNTGTQSMTVRQAIYPSDGSSNLATVFGDPITLAPGETGVVRLDGVTMPAGTTRARYVLTSGPTGNIAGIRFIVEDRMVLELSARWSGHFYAGDRSPEGDLTPSWVGPVNGSHSILTGRQVVGFGGGNGQVVTYQTTDAPRHSTAAGRAVLVYSGSIGIFQSASPPIESGKEYTLVMNIRPKDRDLIARLRIRAANGPFVVFPQGEWTEARVTLVAGNGSESQTGLLITAGSGHLVSDRIDFDLSYVFEGAGYIPATKRINVHRGAARIDLGQKVDVGLMTFELHNEEDPLSGGTFKPGQKVTALAAGAEIFTGTVADVSSAYPLNKLTGKDRAHVVITVADAVQQLSTHMRHGVTSAEGYETFESRINRYALNTPVPVEAPAEGGPREVYAF